MSDTTTEEAGQKTEAPLTPINILAQYIRDFSFENPNAPEALRGNADAPEMDINIGMDARKIPNDEIENLYEVVINLRAAAARGEETLFILEMQYGVAVTLIGVPEDNHHPVLLIEVPRLAFPFVRQIVSDATLQAGYPPLMLSPVDFQAIYMERFKDEIAAAKEGVRKDVEETMKKSGKNSGKNDKEKS